MRDTPRQRPIEGQPEPPADDRVMGGGKPSVSVTEGAWSKISPRLRLSKNGPCLSSVSIA